MPEALADRAYYAIRELIVSLDLRPGLVVNERELMQRLDLGRTPIREAVRRLAQEQLVEVFPRRGTFVTNVEIRDLASICDVRSASSRTQPGSPPSARMRPIARSSHT